MSSNGNEFLLIIEPKKVELGKPVQIRFIDKTTREEGDQAKTYRLIINDKLRMDLAPKESSRDNAFHYTWELDTGDETFPINGYIVEPVLIIGSPTGSNSTNLEIQESFSVHSPVESISRSAEKIANRDEFPVALNATDRTRTPDLPLWLVILKSTQAMSFNRYNDYMDLVFCNGEVPAIFLNENNKNSIASLRKRRFLPFNDTDGYRTLKVATEAFVMINCGVNLRDQGRGTDADGISDPLDEASFKAILDQRNVNVKEGDSFRDIWKSYLLDHEDLGKTGLNSISENLTIPYLYLIRRKLKDAPLKLNNIDDILQRLGISDTNDIDEANCFGVIAEKLRSPCFLELIWSYWHEESMLVQVLNVIARRFQNIRGGKKDPLAGLEIDPIRPLNNLLWGYIQDERNRLSVSRRGLEYLHHYGFSLQGKAVADLQAAETRSRFMSAFHQLLRLCAQFYLQEDNNTIRADAFPIRNALREVHIILSEGAHNQFGDMPSTARIEMLMQQWILARPEFRQFIPTRNMVANPEPWMDNVAGVNNLMGWTDMSPVHFNNLAIFGEQLLLSIRYGAWSQTNTIADQAAVWAIFWRQAVQEYIHAYNAVTGVDLSKTLPASANADQLDSLPPSYFLMKRLQQQQRSNGSLSSYDKKTNGGSKRTNKSKVTN